MDQIHVTLPDGSVKDFPKGVTPVEIAKSISPRLADAALVAKVYAIDGMALSPKLAFFRIPSIPSPMAACSTTCAVLSSRTSSCVSSRKKIRTRSTSFGTQPRIYWPPLSPSCIRREARHRPAGGKRLLL